MTCLHLRELYSLCQKHDLKIASSELVHIVCKQCGVAETCPSTCADEYDQRLSPHEVPSGPEPRA